MKMSKKGFTIVELVIVIAVIGILAAVLIPTFSGIVEKANRTAALENARNEISNYLIYNEADIEGIENTYYNGTDTTEDKLWDGKYWSVYKSEGKVTGYVYNDGKYQVVFDASGNYTEKTVDIEESNGLTGTEDKGKNIGSDGKEISSTQAQG